MTTITEDHKQALLRQHFLLRHLRDWDLKRLAMVSRIERAEAGRLIFRKGEPGSSMMVVIDGQVLIFTTASDRKEVVFNIISRNEVFGEIAVLDGKERTADAKAMRDTSYLVLDRRHLVPFLEAAPKVCVELLTVLCARLRQSSQQLEDSAFLELRPRLARKLLAFAEHFATPDAEGKAVIDLAVSQGELGAMLNASRESVNRQLRSFVKDGLVLVDQGRITVLDEMALEDVAAEEGF